jgi:hypothetical protein
VENKMEKTTKCYVCGRKLQNVKTMRVVESPKDEFGVKVPVGRICKEKSIAWTEEHAPFS